MYYFIGNILRNIYNNIRKVKRYIIIIVKTFFFKTLLQVSFRVKVWQRNRSLYTSTVFETIFHKMLTIFFAECDKNMLNLEAKFRKAFRFLLKHVYVIFYLNMSRN